MKPKLFLSLIAAVVLSQGLAAAKPEQEVTLPAGTLLHLRLDKSIGSDLSRVEEPVRAELTRPVVVQGRTVIPAKAVALGHVTAVRRAGHLKQRSLVTLRFSTVEIPSAGERYPIRTRAWGAMGPPLGKRTAEGIALPAVGGAIVGGLIGGGKGAAIGAAAGGGAGTARLMVTRGKDVRVGRGALIVVRLAQPLRVVVPQR